MFTTRSFTQQEVDEAFADGTHSDVDLPAEEIVEKKKSDTIFIFGSGRSILDITPDEWQKMSQHNTISFNRFHFQNFIDVDYHLLREILVDNNHPELYQQFLLEHVELLNRNPRYDKAHLLFQRGTCGDDIIKYGLVNSKTISRFDNTVEDKYAMIEPFGSWKQGLVHGMATIFDCLNFAWIFGWKKIVLVGVDLYDRRYFYLEENETQLNDLTRVGKDGYKMEHNTSKGVLAMSTMWRKYFNNRGVELYSYNPKSLLTDCMPIFDWDVVKQQRVMMNARHLLFGPKGVLYPLTK